MFIIFNYLHEMTNFDREYFRCDLWKKLWKVCITFRMKRILWCYGNDIQKFYTGKTQLFVENRLPCLLYDGRNPAYGNLWENIG